MKPLRRGSAFERARMARLAAVQAYYQLLMQDQSAEKVIATFIEDKFSLGDYTCRPEIALFKALVEHSADRKEDITVMIESALNEDWNFDRLEKVLQAILYVSTAELLTYPTAAPAPVIIQEYGAIARSFFEGKEPVFLNGYLDRLARKLDYTMTRPKVYSSEDILVE